MKSLSGLEVVLLFTVFGLSYPCLFAQAVQLPTPEEAFHDYDPEAETRRLIQDIMANLDPNRRVEVMRAAVLLSGQGSEQITSAEIRAFLDEINWERYRARVLRLLIYRSGVFDVFEGGFGKWLRVIHDFLLFFLDRMPEDRLVERIVGQLKLKQVDDPGKRTLALIESTPSLQKLGQILARYPAVPTEMQHYLQQLENSIQTLRREDLVEFIVADLGDAIMKEYSIEFSDSILAEATVGAVIKASFQEPGHATRQEAVCKVIKPRSVAALTEELEILDGIVHYFEANGHIYDIGDVPLTQMFQDARNALEQEIQVVQEQSNLVRAYNYYRDDPDVEVPKVYDFSTENVTFMKFIKGGKITDAFLGDKLSRARLAKSLGKIMTIDVIFSPREKAIFHGDPHAGNVFSIDDAESPYKIGLLDWGLCGELDKEQREKLIQLILGLKLGNTKRIANNVDALLKDPIPDTPENAQIRQTLGVKTIEVSNGKFDYFQVLGGLVADLAREGFVLDFNVALFIKAQVTITGILQELDPGYNRGDELFAWVRGEVYRELPKRLLYTVYFPKWTSHDYRTMISNEDVKDVQFKSIGRGFAKFGRGFWAVVSWPFRQPEPAGSP